MANTHAAVIDEYFRAVNAQDIAAIAACFAESAVVHDEGEEHRGLEAITGWIAQTTDKYHISAVVSAIEEQGAETVVTAQIAGTFPGSPIELHYYFTIVGERIGGLRVG